MKPRRFLLICLLTIVCSALGTLHSAHADTSWSGLTDYTIRVDGYQRTYHVHLPASYTGRKSLPLVVALHASRDNGPNMSGLTHFNDVADSNDVIATYPDALNGIWNTDGSAPQDDFNFISAMIQQMRSAFAINGHQIYAMGFSEGGEMTEELGCKLSSQFSAIASISGHMASTNTCRLAHPMPLITFHGTADTVWSYTGWAGLRGGQHLTGAVDAENKWASLASCSGNPTTSKVPNKVLSDGTTEKLTVISKCKAGVQMQLYTITNGGHTWPGGMALPWFGLTTLDIDASTLIWQFFAHYQF
ncbi:MAG: hypothetical protein H0X37_05475 [Herpetosiphonaceae bacterium]|nr:hypothetical protein [Herpetosiphonaceae bacterium]